MHPNMLCIDRMHVCVHLRIIHHLLWQFPNQIKHSDLKVHEEHVHHFNGASTVLDSNTHAHSQHTSFYMFELTQIMRKPDQNKKRLMEIRQSEDSDPI